MRLRYAIPVRGTLRIWNGSWINTGNIMKLNDIVINIDIKMCKNNFKNIIRNNKLNIGNYSYLIRMENENKYILIPKSDNYLCYNSFVPKVEISISGDSVEFNYSLMQGVKIIYYVISALITVMFLIAIILLVQNNTFNIGVVLFPMMNLINYLLVKIGFYLMYKATRKKLDAILFHEMFEGV